MGYIASHSNPEVASRILDQLESTFQSIALNPAIGAIDPVFGSEGVRKFTKRKYIIYYAMVGSKVRILRVIHGARLQPRALRKPL